MGEMPWQYRLAGKCCDTHYNTFSGKDKGDPMLYLDNPYEKFPLVYMAFGRREYKELFPENLLSKKQIEELMSGAEKG